MSSSYLSDKDAVRKHNPLEIGFLLDELFLQRADRDKCQSVHDEMLLIIFLAFNNKGSEIWQDKERAYQRGGKIGRVKRNLF